MKLNWYDNNFVKKNKRDYTQLYWEEEKFFHLNEFEDWILSIHICYI